MPPREEHGGRRASDKDFTFLLGKIDGTLGGMKEDIADIKSDVGKQNGHVAENTKEVFAMREVVASLPCSVHDEKLKNHIKNHMVPAHSSWRKRVEGGGMTLAIIIAVLSIAGKVFGIW